MVEQPDSAKRLQELRGVCPVTDKLFAANFSDQNWYQVVFEEGRGVFIVINSLDIPQIPGYVSPDLDIMKRAAEELANLFDFSEDKKVNKDNIEALASILVICGFEIFDPEDITFVASQFAAKMSGESVFRKVMKEGTLEYKLAAVLMEGGLTRIIAYETDYSGYGKNDPKPRNWWKVAGSNPFSDWADGFLG